jgi:hypothetical protein
MSTEPVTSRPGPAPRKSMPLRTPIVTMAVTFVLTVLLVTAYISSGCRLGDPPH